MESEPLPADAALETAPTADESTAASPKGAAQLSSQDRDPEQWLNAVADEKGLGNEFRRIVDTARDLGLHARFQNNWWIVKLTPKTNRSRGLIDLDSSLMLWVATDEIATHLGCSQEDVRAALGENRTLQSDEVDAWIDRLRILFSQEH